MDRLTFGHRMEKIFKLQLLRNARPYLIYGLVFFLLVGCKQKTEAPFSLVFKDDKAMAVHISQNSVDKFAIKDAPRTIKIVVWDDKNKQGIIGGFKENGSGLDFQPAIPFTPGITYDILQNNEAIGGFAVPFNKGPAPSVTVIYPQTDTVPENLLKIYIRFSHPMRTGNALDHVYLLEKNRDTMQRVFLNLQPELWDKLGTTLTLWLDPGRIKRDLVLNRELGNPLKKSQSYQLVIRGDWKDERGLPLGKNYTKQFTVAGRDGEIPDINKWQLTIPKACTKAALKISTGEPLDHYLLYDSVYIIAENGEELKGKVTVTAKDKLWVFTPESAWTAGHYQLKVYSRLEDLAGNNLNRVFDRDIHKDTQQNKDFFVRGFEVK